MPVQITALAIVIWNSMTRIELDFSGDGKHVVL